MMQLIWGEAECDADETIQLEATSTAWLCTGSMDCQVTVEYIPEPSCADLDNGNAWPSSPQDQEHLYAEGPVPQHVEWMSGAAADGSPDELTAQAEVLQHAEWML